MGADDSCIGRFLASQALGNALIGSVVGLATSFAIAHAMSSARAPVILTSEVAVASVVLMIVVCLVAAWLPYWRIQRIDPVSVLRN
jgi:ABC-type antimicrobial peptide transport system permease subunit